jgi:hypothetical protein
MSTAQASSTIVKKLNAKFKINQRNGSKEFSFVTDTDKKTAVVQFFYLI